jgi:DNA-binding PadR family transcriptional regulator
LTNPSRYGIVSYADISYTDISYNDYYREEVQLRMREGQDARDLLPLTPAVLHILLALANEERHGYGIMKEVEDRSGGEVRLGPGTLYGAIKRMLFEGLIEESDERPDPELDDQRRRYYQITDFGRRVAGAEAERLQALVNTARARKLLPTRKSRLLPEGS